MPRFSKEKVLLFAAYVTANEGYKPLSQGDSSTSSQVLDLCFDPSSLSESELLQYKDRVTQALDWLQTQPTSEYYTKLKSLLSHPDIPEEKVGFASSLFSGYDRHLSRVLTQQIDRKSQFVSQEGQEITIPITSYHLLKNGTNKNGKSYYLYKIYSDSNIFIWFAHRDSDDVLKYKKITATVTKHDQYNGVNQNIINYVYPIKD